MSYTLKKSYKHQSISCPLVKQKQVGMGGGYVFNTTETVNVMIHMFVSLVNQIANHLIQKWISKTTLSRRQQVRIQPAEGDLFHT